MEGRFGKGWGVLGMHDVMKATTQGISTNVVASQPLIQCLCCCGGSCDYALYSFMCNIIFSIPLCIFIVITFASVNIIENIILNSRILEK